MLAIKGLENCFADVPFCVTAYGMPIELCVHQHYTLYVKPRRVYCLSKDFFWKMNCHDFSCHKNQHYHSPPNSPLCTTAQKMHHQTKHSRLVEYEQI